MTRRGESYPAVLTLPRYVRKLAEGVIWGCCWQSGGRARMLMSSKNLSGLRYQWHPGAICLQWSKAGRGPLPLQLLSYGY